MSANDGMDLRDFGVVVLVVIIFIVIGTWRRIFRKGLKEDD